MARSRSRSPAAALLMLASALLAACTLGPEPLMPTPVIYEDGALDPFAHLAPEACTPALDVFYATTRAPTATGSELPYGNAPSEVIRLGRAQVRFGDGLTWEELRTASTDRHRARQIHLRLGEVSELATLGSGGAADVTARAAFAAELDRRIAAGLDPELLVYVHGARVDFYRCTVRTAQLLHFAGRDLAGIAFDWPSHTSILSYVFGGDRRRAVEAGEALATLLEFLASETSARRIHLLGYSAGGETLAKGLGCLRRKHPELGPEELHARQRIGTVLFAASDVDTGEFLADLPAVHDLAERVVVTASDEDSALVAAARYMGGGARIGTEAAAERLGDAARRDGLPRLEVVDVSRGKETRGFDITGHHYWHAHPWVASDVILNLRLSLTPEQRGLSATEEPRVWYLPAHYPEEARAALRRELGAVWHSTP